LMAGNRASVQYSRTLSREAAICRNAGRERI
jgi:hypothetical protein